VRQDTRSNAETGAEEPREVPGLFVRGKAGAWLVNVGLVAWHLGPVPLREARKQLRAEGRKLGRLGGREFVECASAEVNTFFGIADYWGRVLAGEFRRIARGG